MILWYFTMILWYFTMIQWYFTMILWYFTMILWYFTMILWYFTMILWYFTMILWYFTMILWVFLLYLLLYLPQYHNDPKFSNRQVWANIADPDQTAPRAIPFASFWQNSLRFIGLFSWILGRLQQSFLASKFLGILRYTAEVTEVMSGLEFILTTLFLGKTPGDCFPVLSVHSFAITCIWQLLLNQLKRKNGHRNIFMSKSSRKNVPDVGSIPGPLASQSASILTEKISMSS